MIVFHTEDIQGKIATLRDSESKHCNRVLRKNLGDRVHVIDGKGMFAIGTITRQDKKTTTIEIEHIEHYQEAVFKGIAICPTKNMSRFEIFLEKATEIGINNIYPIVCNRSERRVLKEDRLNKILISAAKQSKNFHFPKLHPLQSFETFVEQISKENIDLFIGHYSQDNPKLFSYVGNEKKQLVVIGPEGDFTEEELRLANSHGFVCINLANSRLRTETAGIVASSFICA